ncbi:putative disease resistance protein RGA3 [Beta vulgaris subsp. vulgaris]|uniref:putative disease resistance protein RGA3 n=1 Tax=Beta vulgaris subsp. vulgaris TaxID=3555 RepID=UPI0020366AA5|nr:putative disease resistance protein RGA3 [Beta vulgaris subsp. vulgaris]
MRDSKILDSPFLYAALTSLLQKLHPDHLEKNYITTISDAIDVKKLQDILTSLSNALSSQQFDDSFLNSILIALYDVHDSLDEYVYLTSAEGKDKCLRAISSISMCEICTRPPTKNFPLKDKEKYLQSFSIPSVSSELNVEELPPHLVPCLAYCSFYPKNTTFVREILVNQWIAQGFISSTKGDEELEQIGNRYFDELCVRGVFQAPIYAFGENTDAQTLRLQEPSRVFGCVMHPLAHEFACNISLQDVCIFDRRYMKRKGVSNPRGTGEGSSFVTFQKNGLSKVNLEIAEMECREARTFISFSPHWDVFAPDKFSKFFHKLLVLDLSGSYFEVLPSLFNNSYSLKYLRLSRNKQLKRLNVRQMKHLQTLVVDGCIRLDQIHMAFRTRHLYLTSKQINVDLRRLMSLQVLELFQCLELRSLGAIGSSTLKILRIFECPMLDLNPNIFEAQTCIEELVFHNCASLDLGRVEKVKLPRLKYLELIGLPKLLELPGWLQYATALQYILISECEELHGLTNVLQHLKSLKKLCIYSCPNLHSLPEVIYWLPNLQLIDIRKCPCLTQLPTIHDWVSRSNLLQVSHDGRLLQNQVRTVNFSFPGLFPHCKCSSLFPPNIYFLCF